jgi:hypothetical protein
MDEHRVFLSYNRADRHAAEQIAARLSKAGLQVWTGHEPIAAGADIVSTIEEAMRQSDTFVLLLAGR